MNRVKINKNAQITKYDMVAFKSNKKEFSGIYDYFLVTNICENGMIEVKPLTGPLHRAEATPSFKIASIHFDKILVDNKSLKGILKTLDTNNSEDRIETSSFNDCDIIKFKPEWSNPGEENIYHIINLVNKESQRCYATPLHGPSTKMALAGSSPAGFIHMENQTRDEKLLILLYQLIRE